ncbi:hypothetical protein [Aquibacillus albus]|uniref:Uncharacterized protein n=1 Tax=Aquibacillus albus TaxID=1168171 RepID=A0ABS2N207_9BACI|nr:hypothetical protein [Aquibacillus albus]MBM7572166.1 hypothetical protein [Aquibacillus albus]
MKKLLVLVLVIGFALCNVTYSEVSASDRINNEVKDEEGEKQHNWKKTGSEFEMIPADTHEYTVWHNFIKKKRKCDITYKVMTEVWYCEIHHHTKTEVSLEETIHSHEHS